MAQEEMDERRKKWAEGFARMFKTPEQLKQMEAEKRKPAGLQSDLKKAIKGGMKDLGKTPVETQPLPDISGEQKQLDKILLNKDPNMKKEVGKEDTEAGFKKRYKEETPLRRKFNEAVPAPFNMMRDEPSDMQRRSLDTDQWIDKYAADDSSDSPWYKSEGLKNWAMALGPSLAMLAAAKAGGRYGVEWAQGIGSGLDKAMKTHMELQKAAQAQQNKEADRELKKAGLILDKIQAKQQQYSIEKGVDNEKAKRTYQELQVLMKGYADITNAATKKLKEQRDAKSESVPEDVKAARREYGKGFGQYVSNYEKQVQPEIQKIKEFRQVAAELSKARPNKLLGQFPDAMRSLVGDDGKLFQERVLKPMMTTLTESLGAQFTENEARRLLNMSFDPRDHWSVNYKKLIWATDKLEEKLRNSDQKYRSYINDIGTTSFQLPQFDVMMGGEQGARQAPSKKAAPSKAAPAQPSVQEPTEAEIQKGMKAWGLSAEQARQTIIKRRSQKGK
jgi:hypothetical protein